MKKRYWVIYDADGDLLRTRRVSAMRRKHVVQFMRAVYGDGVRIRSIAEGF